MLSKDTKDDWHNPYMACEISTYDQMAKKYFFNKTICANIHGSVLPEEAKQMFVSEYLKDKKLDLKESSSLKIKRGSNCVTINGVKSLSELGIKQNDTLA